jgi:hypothetical protein
LLTLEKESDLLTKPTRRKNTKAIGEISEMMVTAALIKDGHIVLKPYGDNQRYDLVIDVEGQFKRIQVKTAQKTGSGFAFSTASTYAHRGHKRSCYIGVADLFGVYYPVNDTCYIIPVEGCPATLMSLGLVKPLNNQVKGRRMADAFRIGV